MREKFRAIVKVLLVAAFAVPLFTHAYTEINIAGSMILDVTPKYPAPGETVKIRATSYSMDLNQARITWEGNGSTVAAGIGQREIQFKAGMPGTLMTITVSALAPDGDLAEKELIFRPAGVDLIWQAQSYTPPYYRGRALPTGGSDITIEAVPDFIKRDGTRISTGNLVYEWFRDDEKIEQASGYGKSIFTVKYLSNFSNEVIGVKVQDEEGILIAEKRIKVPTLSPKIELYEEDPLEGTKFMGALENIFDLFSTEIVLRAEPFFYPLSGDSFDSEWRVNNRKAQPSSGSRNVLTLRQPGTQKGEASIAYSVDNKSNLWQSQQKVIVVRFGSNRPVF